MYRTWIPVSARFSTFRGSREEIWFSPFVWIKGNIQPWKKGEGIVLETEGIMRLTDYQVIYTKKEPVYDLTDRPAPDEGKEWGQTGTFTYFDNAWWAVLMSQDWTRGGRAIKHYKWFASRQEGQDIPEIDTPIPFGELVDNFDNVVRELKQNIPVLQSIGQ